MTSYLPPTHTATANISAPSSSPSSSSSSSPGDDDSYGDDNDDNDNDNDNDDSNDEDTPQFPRFMDLPPELRHQIWRAVIPARGINFFNVHCFPNDHVACSRSASPPWSYLDLRRLSIDDTDAAVARYDPSSWQARAAVRQSCREARHVCAVPGHKAANVTLTRPRRGLFVRAADGQLRTTPLRVPVHNRDRNRDRNRATDGHGEGYEEDHSSPPPPVNPEPVVRRIIQVHIDDILCLSVENCSFNLPFEDSPSSSSPPRNHHRHHHHNDNDNDEDDEDDDEDDDDDREEGWAYDPQLTPALPRCIPADRLCANLALHATVSLRFAADALFGLLYAHIPGYLELPPGELWPGRLLLMFDDDVMRHHKDVDEEGKEWGEEEEEDEEVVWDRFGDSYVRLPWKGGRGFLRYQHHQFPDDFPLVSQLVKTAPETSNMRERYLASARLRSPKRPARSS
ncbi:hypothetical protein F5B17DRAFT_443506 [Nemania serpens]|nr:hypothetical protein F5B17DRAFT_443506 [Nemania serpens]